MLRYSEAALAVRPRFYRHMRQNNSIDIYVEDSDDEIFYEKLMGKILDESIKVRKVFGTGGKNGLFNKMRKYNSNPPSKLAFFIADGDFDRIIGTRLPKSKNLHILREYCVENFIIEDIAVYNLMQEELAKKSLHKLKSLFNMREWLKSSIDDLTPLFACYIVIQKHKLGLKNVKNGVGPFITQNGIPNLDKRKVAKFVENVKNQYPMLNGVEFEQELQNIKNIMGDSWYLRKRYICGKEYLLPLLRFELKRYLRRDFEEKSFRFRVMKNAHLNSLNTLKRKIESLVFVNAHSKMMVNAN